MKSENIYNNKATVDVDAQFRIVNSNATFKRFFPKKIESSFVEITQLIEFDDLSKFKKSFIDFNEGKKCETTFKGKIKTPSSERFVIVKVVHPLNQDSEWSNEIVSLECHESFDLSLPISNRILELSPLKVFAIDKNYQLKYFNSNFLDLAKIIFKKIPKIGINFLPKGENREEWKNYFDIVFQGEEIVIEKTYKTDTSEFYDLITLTPIKNILGETNGCIFYAEDILALKNVENDLYDKKRLYHDLFENNVLGIGLVDDNCKLIRANDSFCRLSNISHSEVSGWDVCSLMDKEETIKIKNRICEIRNNKLHNFTANLKWFPHNSTMKYVQVGISGLFDANKFAGCMISLLDISVQKQAEKRDQVIAELKNKEDLNLKHQLLLQQELDSHIRELSTNQMLISQKANLLKIISQELNKIYPKTGGSVKKDIQKIITMIKSQNVFEDNWSNLKVHFVKMHPSFFQSLKKRSKEITEKDLRHCAYLKIGLSVKETAQLLSLEPKSVEMARYRIKKKLNLDISEKLSDFLGSL